MDGGLVWWKVLEAIMSGCRLAHCACTNYCLRPWVTGGSQNYRVNILDHGSRDRTRRLVWNGSGIDHPRGEPFNTG